MTSKYIGFRQLQPFAERYLARITMLAPLWWLAGIDFIIYPLSSFIGYIFRRSGIDSKASQRIKHYISSFSHRLFCFSLAAMISTYFVSSCVALLQGAEVGRFFAAQNNIITLLMGFALYISLSFLWTNNYLIGKFDLRMKAWTNSFAVIFIAILLMSILTYCLAFFIPQDEIKFTTLLGLLAPKMPGLLGLYERVDFVSIDWIGPGKTGMRLMCLAPYATAASLLYAVIGAMLIIGMRKKHSWLKMLIGSIIFFLIIFTKTRSAIVGYILGALGSRFLFGPIFHKIAAIFTTIILVLFIMLPDVNKFISSYREGSTKTRELNFHIAIEKVINHNPFIGLGTKPSPKGIYAYKIPVGSHSTILSSFTKGGVVGLLFMMLAFYVAPLIGWIKTASLFFYHPEKLKFLREEAYQLFRAQSILWVWMVTEDLDAPIFAAYCAFLLLSYIQLFHRRCLSIIRDEHLLALTES